MFAHEIKYEECIHCGSEFCYGQCRYGESLSYVSSERKLEVLPALQATQRTGELRQGQESSRQAAPPLQTLPPRVPIIAKTHTRSHFSGCNALAIPYFDSYGELGDF